MHQDIKWADSPRDRKSFLANMITPFDKGQWERPLRITFHDSTLKELPEFEKVALDALKEFAEVESLNLSALSTEPSSLRFIEIGGQPENGYIPVTVRNSKEHYLQSGIMFPNQFPSLASQMVSRLGGDPENHEEALQDLLVARAHHSIHQDLLITSSKWLLANREIGFVDDANPCLPSEAIKIMGLLLRVREDFRYASRASFDRGLFYWALVRHKLPAMWKYFSACVYSEKSRGDDILVLGQSILVRCERALQACDEIGRMFYVKQSNNTRDETMYHFDYLTLLLSGALDAQARVAYRAYALTTPKRERDASFRRDGFVNEISKVDNKLSDFLNSNYFKDIGGLVSKMRNTIHGSALTTTGYINGIDPEKSFIQIPETESQIIWDISEKYASPEEWGLINLASNIAIEPYAFSQKLIACTLDLVNTIASLTQIEKLFPEDTEVPLLNDGPPADNQIFSSEIGERLVLLS